MDEVYNGRFARFAEIATRLRQVSQSSYNFGKIQRHEDPELSEENIY